MSALLLALLACRWPSEPTEPEVPVDPVVDSEPPTPDSDPPTEPPADPWSYWPPEDGTRPVCTPRELLWRAENAPRLDNYGGLIALAWHPETGLRTWVELSILRAETLAGLDGRALLRMISPSSLIDGIRQHRGLLKANL